MTQGYLTQISVAADGSVWGVALQHPSDLDNIYRWTGSGWELVRGQHLTSVAVGSQGNVWGVNTQQAPGQNNIYRWTGSTAMSNVFRWTGATWELVGGKYLTGVSVANDHSVWGVDALQFAGSNNVYAWNGRNWDARDAFLTQVVNAGGAQVWGINADHIYGNSPEPTSIAG